MKAYKLTITVIDHDEVGAAGIAFHIENQRYPNHCISPQAQAVETAEIGEWSDDHRANYKTWDVGAEEWEAAQ